MLPEKLLTKFTGYVISEDMTYGAKANISHVSELIPPFIEINKALNEERD